MNIEIRFFYLMQVAFHIFLSGFIVPSNLSHHQLRVTVGSQTCMPSSLVIFSSTVRVSVFASLLVIGKSKHKAYSMMVPSDLMRISSTLDPTVFDDPSTCMVYNSLGSSSDRSSFGGSPSFESSSSMVHSKMKSANICALMEG